MLDLGWHAAWQGRWRIWEGHVDLDMRPIPTQSMNPPSPLPPCATTTVLQSCSR